MLIRIVQMQSRYAIIETEFYNQWWLSRATAIIALVKRTFVKVLDMFRHSLAKFPIWHRMGNVKFAVRNSVWKRLEDIQLGLQKKIMVSMKYCKAQKTYATCSIRACWVCMASMGKGI